MLSRSFSSTHLLRMSSNPILYKNPFIRMYGATFIDKICFFFVIIPSSVCPSSKNWAISSNSTRTDSIRNKCASGKSSLNPIGSSPVSILDKWSGPTFNLPGLTTTSNLNSWNNSSHQQICP